MDLTLSDIDIYNSLIDINKTYTKMNGQEMITDNDINNYLDNLYGLEKDNRIFSFAKTYLGKQLKKYAAIAM
ncbi:hypothetical protein J2Z43_002602 [Clostridioides mangenotii]|uniref:Uncharacterized protein n=1 Tax=Metaclostridioides mangenotii TaxID=1540 RepID=A0ABS4EDZ0_9FIRM|nr:hypothetical protein [Clostridioides mangenotii]